MSLQKLSSFNRDSALEFLGIEQLLLWEVEAAPIEISAFFEERLERLHRNFALYNSESAKELLIDAFCEEALERRSQLQAWKEAPLRSDTLTGFVDYLIAQKRAYLGPPLLCVVEAKKDDFEQGTAQCLVSMDACAWQNAQKQHVIPVFGVVTNGSGWQFYQRGSLGEYRESVLFTSGDAPRLLGALDFIFAECEKNLVS
jgi:hypothetical protein